MGVKTGSAEVRHGEGAWAYWPWLLGAQALDRLSLYLTWRGLQAGEEWTLRRVPRCQGDEQGVDIVVAPDGAGRDALACTLRPWPFADDEVHAPVEARFIADRPYRDADDLAGALAAAPVTVLPMRVRRP